MEFSIDGLIKTFNSDLANDYGNLLSRGTAMIDKFCGGIIPRPCDTDSLDEEIQSLAAEVVQEFGNLMEKMDFTGALTAIWRLIRRANKFLDETAPWSLAKDQSNGERLGTVLYNIAEVSRITTILVSPFSGGSPGEFLAPTGTG